MVCAIAHIFDHPGIRNLIIVTPNDGIPMPFVKNNRNSLPSIADCDLAIDSAG